MCTVPNVLRGVARKGRLPYCAGALLLSVLVPRACSSDNQFEWHPGNGFRWAGLSVPPDGKAGFRLLTPVETGLAFTNRLLEWDGAANRVLLNGSGVTVGDYDYDGLADIYFCGLDTPNALYKNLGNWKFREVTAEAGVTCAGKFFRGAVFADLNGDRFLDLLVTATGRGVICFLNDGKGRFRDVTTAAGTGSSHGSVTLALADVDGNGTLDLYLANNRTDDIRDRGQVDLHLLKGKVVVPPAFQDRLLVVNGGLLEYGEPDQLLLNDGEAHFRTVSWTNGTFLDEQRQVLREPPRDWGLAAAFRDLNDDGFPDLYVCNDFWTPDRVWINDGQGRFRALGNFALRNMSASSMGVDFADIDRDGRMDFFVVDMLSRDPRLRKRQILAQTPAASPIGVLDDRPQFMRNTLYHNRGDGTFAEVAHYAGLPASDWSWSPVFLDVDLDGFEDVLITAGHVKDVQDLDAEAQIKTRQRSYRGYTNQLERRQAFTYDKMVNERLYPKLDMPIVAFRNLGTLRFEEATSRWGTDQLGVHHGLAAGDFDNDGDLDFVVNNLGSPAGLYRNETTAPRVAVRLKGASSNTQGIGAKVKLLDGAVPLQSQEVSAGGRYSSGSDPLLVFAAGSQKKPMKLEVTWRSGRRSVIRDVLPDRLYEIGEAGAPENSSIPSTRSGGAFFRDVSTLLGHTHHEEIFDDFARQPLLPDKLSQLGPGVAWCDVDTDGHIDLIVGSGKGGRLAVFRGNGRGAFERLSAPPFDAPVTRDVTAIVGWHGPDGTPALLVGSANYEDGLAVGASVRQYDTARKNVSDAVPGDASSVGPITLGDLDGDGTLELFVGGRVVPGRYPEAAGSRVYRHVNGGWQLDATNSRSLKKFGLVNGAVWSDLTGDGFPELVLACDWGPVRVFRNEAGVLRDATVECGLDKLTGRWNGIATGDVDEDGDLDIVAANWGQNSADKATPERPLFLYYGELAQPGNIDVIETEYDRLTGALAPRRMLAELTHSLPFLSERFPTHRAYSEATLSALLRSDEARTRRVQVTTLASMIFINRGGRFNAVELPREAQLAPAFSVNVADFDGDGHEDVFLSQNFFATRATTPRLDAGRGLWLQGDGQGKFSPVPGTESGIRVYGEQRGAACGDFDEDGRLDLAVSQNGAATILLQNVGARPGLRVRLLGPPGNPAAVGAAMRVLAGNSPGPTREIHAGSGHWSQDSPIQIMSRPEQPAKLWVRWPGGSVTTTAIPAESREVIVDRQGRLK